MTESIRLAKRVAELFACSRTEATHYIESGSVTVNGAVVEEPGFRVGLQEQIELVPDATLAPIEAVTFLFHKPSGISVEEALAMLVPENRSVLDHPAKPFLKRHVVGLTALDPLPLMASGLLVFTQDWRVRRKLVDDLDTVEQEFVVEISGEMIADGLQNLNQISKVDGKAVPSRKVSWQNESRLRFAMKAARVYLIEQLCLAVGLKVVSIKRLRIGRMPLAALAVGQWRYLAGYERF